MKMSSRLTGIITEKDIHSVITDCNHVFLEYAGVQSIDCILGYTDQHFPWQDYADIYRAHELDALVGNQYSTIIPLKNSFGEDLLFLHTKIQKKDADGKVIGVSCRAIEIINQDSYKLSKLLAAKSEPKRQVYHLGKKLSSIILSKRQKEVLFFLTRGKSPKNIAAIFGLSVRTIEYYIDIIRNKFGCHTRWELIDVAVSQGFCDAIPESESHKNLVEMIAN